MWLADGSCGRDTTEDSLEAPEEEHTVTVAKVLSWLGGVASSPTAKLKDNRLRERLRL
jgi:hypothetical protein